MKFQTKSTNHGGRGSIGVLVVFSNHHPRPSYASMECNTAAHSSLRLFPLSSQETRDLLSRADTS